MRRTAAALHVSTQSTAVSTRSTPGCGDRRWPAPRCNRLQPVATGCSSRLQRALALPVAGLEGPLEKWHLAASGVDSTNKTTAAGRAHGDHSAALPYCSFPGGRPLGARRSEKRVPSAASRRSTGPGNGLRSHAPHSFQRPLVVRPSRRMRGHDGRHVECVGMGAAALRAPSADWSTHTGVLPSGTAVRCGLQVAAIASGLHPSKPNGRFTWRITNKNSV